jgi:DNA (cytosine-5)-methyltransferase 1
MKLLDLFCCQGGAAMGYHRAGFEVVGVDIVAQPRYPFEFHQGDALEYLAAHGHEFHAIHASPPCQRYSESTPVKHREAHPDLIGPTRDALLALDKPFAIENVDGARFLLHNPLLLCGSMFGLDLRRHRWFELWPIRMLLTPPCRHIGSPGSMTWPGSNTTNRVSDGWTEKARGISGCHWMTWAGLQEAIPPAYTEFIGKHLLAALEVTA